MVSVKNVETRVLAKQIDLLYSNQLFAILITSSIVAISFLYLSASIDWVDLKTPFIVFVFAMSLRTFASYQYYSARTNKSINLIQAESYYLIGIVATGVFWCIATLSLFPLLDLKGQILLLVIITGFATGAQTTMGFLRAPVTCFMLLLFMPLVYVIYHANFPGAGDVAVAMIVYFLFILRSSLMFYKNTYDMLLFQEISIDREAELIKEQKKASSANQAKSDFLSRMSHELRTPLNAILGFAELQLRDKAFPLPEKQSLRVKKISDAGNHLLSLVNDVLDFSRIETGSMEIYIEVTNLLEMVTNSMGLFEDKAARRNIEIFADQNQLNFSVMADQNRLKQVIVNLLDNAIKFNKLGGSVSIYADETEKSRVRLFVEDTGFGIQDGDPEDLFLPFSRLNADALGIDGTGIGLSLCKDLIELMGGNIGIDRHSVEGCRFWIELPQVANSNILADNNKLEDKTLDAVNAMKVLLVEDNLVNSEVAVDMLAVLNIDADVARNGQQALEFFQKNHYPLILMDCEMPVMNGFTTTRELRIIEKQQRQKTQIRPAIIIALTAHAILGTKEKCLECGMDDFLSKPFTMNDLHLIVLKWLDMDDLNEAQAEPATVQSVTAKPIANEKVGEELTDVELFDNKLVFDSRLLDRETLFKLFKKQTGSNTNFLSKVIEIYLDQSSTLIGELKLASKEHDIEAIRVISHTLKSSSVNVGALAFSGVCRDLELSCENGNLQQSTIDELYQHYSEAKLELTALIKNIKELN